MTRRIFLVCATASAAWHELAPPKPYTLSAPSPAETTPKPDARLAQAGIHRKLTPAALKAGKWEKTRTPLWRLALRSPGAKAIRLHIVAMNAGAGKLWIHDGARTSAPYTGKGPNGDGDFWSPVLSGDTAVIEYQPASKSKSLPFTIPELSHLFEE